MFTCLRGFNDRFTGLFQTLKLSNFRLRAIGRGESGRSQPKQWVPKDYDQTLIELLRQYVNNEITFAKVSGYFEELGFSRTTVDRQAQRLRMDDPSLNKRQKTTFRKWTNKMEAELASYILQLEAGTISISQVNAWFFETYGVGKGGVRKKIYQIKKQKPNSAAGFQNPTGLAGKQPPELGLASLIDDDWPLDQLERLAECIANRLTVSEICEALAFSLEEVCVRKKITTLIDAKLEVLQLKSGQAFSPSEIDLMLFLKDEGYSNLDIGLRLGRSVSSIKTKISSVRRTMVDISQYDWALFATQKFLHVPYSEWFMPGGIVGNLDSNCILLHPDLFLRKDSLLVDLLREAIQTAEKNRGYPKVWVTSGQEDLQQYVDTQKFPGNVRSLSPLTPKFKALLFASLLGDASLTKRNCPSGKSNYFFRFSQTANLMTQTKELQSHLEYVVWFYNEVDPKNLGPGAFYLERGIELKYPEKGTKYAWRAVVRISDLPEFPEFYSFFYSVDKKTGNMIRKLLPSMGTFKHFFEGSPYVDFMLCHMYMQDGSKRSGLHHKHLLYYTAELFMYTRDESECERLAYMLWQNTGLKFRIKSGMQKNRFTGETVNKTVLSLCLGSVNSFMERIQPHLLPCMEYKRIEPIDTDQFAGVIRDHDQLFTQQLKVWESKF